MRNSNPLESVEIKPAKRALGSVIWLHGLGADGMAHGRLDPVLPIQLGQMAYEFLKGLGYSIEWYDYAIAHQVCPEEIEVVGRWLTQRF